MKYTLDAQGKTLGRFASEIASLLMGKNTTSFTRNELSGVSVEVINASKLKVPAPKMLEKIYLRYSGYPGGLTKSTMSKVIASKGYSEVLTLAVKGMLPDNKLKKGMLKQLTITE